MSMLPPTDIPVTHRFTPGLYIREVVVPSDTIVMTKIHNTEHPFVLSKGVVTTWTEEEGVKKICAPFTGITKAGTRRLCYCHTEVVWTTFHPTTETDVDAIEAKIILAHPVDVEHLAKGYEKICEAMDLPFNNQQNQLSWLGSQ